METTVNGVDDPEQKAVINRIRSIGQTVELSLSVFFNRFAFYYVTSLAVV